eukprot:COSAG06_NODE_62793_length_264_cov_0.618182_1_plen_34_part_10
MRPKSDPPRSQRTVLLDRCRHLLAQLHMLRTYSR